MAGIEGTWAMVEETGADALGRAVAPIHGPKPFGSITFAPSGRVVCVMSDGSDEAKEGPRVLTAFCGRYSYDGKTLIMRLDTSTDPELTATPQRRGVRMHGDALVLQKIGEDGTVRRHTWKKV